MKAPLERSTIRERSTFYVTLDNHVILLVLYCLAA